MDNYDIFENSLYKHVETLRQNFAAANTRFLKVHLASEMVCSLFDQLFSNEFKADHDRLSDSCEKMMLFGVYHSWTYSYILNAAAISDIGMISLRRAIEFTCYISKTHKSDDRAAIWRNQATDSKVQKKFKSLYSVPQAYFKEKYRYLRSLLVFHDMISISATHANFDMIAPKLVTSTDIHRFDMSFQDRVTDIPLMIGATLTAGCLILDALIAILNDSLSYSTRFKESLSNLNQVFREARIELANYKYQGNIPKELIDMIQNDIKTGDIDEYFEKLKSRYETKIPENK